MAKQAPRELPADIEEVRGRLDSWRAGRRKRSPIPKELWEAAVGLARVHGVNPVSTALRLSYDTCKRSPCVNSSPHASPECQSSSPVAGSSEGADRLPT